MPGDWLATTATPTANDHASIDLPTTTKKLMRMHRFVYFRQKRELSGNRENFAPDITGKIISERFVAKNLPRKISISSWLSKKGYHQQAIQYGVVVVVAIGIYSDVLP